MGKAEATVEEWSPIKLDTKREGERREELTREREFFSKIAKEQTHREEEF